jgi:sigma-B regulation protein RsbU (phosphoserine phosphatase)
MMQQEKVLLFSPSKKLFDEVRKIIPHQVAEVVHVMKVDAVYSLTGEVVFALIDGKWSEGEPAELERLFQQLNASAVFTVLVDDEKHIGDEVPHAVSEGLADDLLLTPIRPLELLGKLKHAEYLQKAKDLVSVNSDLKILIEKFEEDLRTARAIQKSLIPEKFPQVHGMKVTHKYLSGMKSGGDYLDFFEFDDKTHVGMLMSDSSGYGLSSAFLSIVLKIAMKLSKEGINSPSATVLKIFEELSITMKPKDTLSIFYGILNRKTFELTYCSAGSIHFFHTHDGQTENRSEGEQGLVKGPTPLLKDKKLALFPEDRLVVVSDGFLESFGNVGRLVRAIEKNEKEDAVALSNEFTFKVKSTLEDEEDFPPQDCSVMVVDIEKRAMRLAK